VSEAFVYMWHDSKNSMYYIGSHRGTPDDGYTHSSQIMEQFKADSIPEGFSRRILAYGTEPDMRQLETDLLNNRKEKCWDKYYNVAICFPPPPKYGKDNHFYVHGKSRIREFRQEQEREYREKNREKLKKKTQEYRKKNREKIREYKKKYREKNREKIRDYTLKNREKNLEYNQKYYKENRERQLDRTREYYKENCEKVIDRQREYREKNREKIREKDRERYARKKAEKIGKSTLDNFLT